MNETNYKSPYAHNNRYLAQYLSHSAPITSMKRSDVNWELTGPLLEKQSLIKIPNKTVSQMIIYKEKKHVSKKEKKIIKTNKMVDDIKNFWEIIKNIKCYDKDEGHMSVRSILPAIKRKNFVLRILNSYIPVIKSLLLDKTSISDAIDENQFNDLITYIIFKGKLFYEAVKKDPELSLYLCTQYSPVYTWLVN
jgi:hypothetical protein